MTTKPALLVIGAGGFGQAVAETAASTCRVLGFLDERSDLHRMPKEPPVIGRPEALVQLAEPGTRIIVAIGDNAKRLGWADFATRQGFELATIVHPSAWVSPSAHLGEGSIVMAHGSIGTEARLGRACIVNTAAVLDHHARLGDGGHLGIGACLSGGAQAGRLVWLQERAVAPPASVLPDGTLLHRGQVFAPG